jgi:hypothetical protein
MGWAVEACGVVRRPPPYVVCDRMAALVNTASAAALPQHGRRVIHALKVQRSYVFAAVEAPHPAV